MEEGGAARDESEASEDPVCLFCGKLIRPADSKVTVQGTTYHSRCWERKTRGRYR